MGWLSVRGAGGMVEQWHLSHLVVIGAALRRAAQDPGVAAALEGADWPELLSWAAADFALDEELQTLSGAAGSGGGDGELDCGLRTMPIDELERYAGALLVETGMGWLEIGALSPLQIIDAWVAAMRYIADRPPSCAWASAKKR